MIVTRIYVDRFAKLALFWWFLFNEPQQGFFLQMMGAFMKLFSYSKILSIAVWVWTTKCSLRKTHRDIPSCIHLQRNGLVLSDCKCHCVSIVLNICHFNNFNVNEVSFIKVVSVSLCISTICLVGWCRMIINALSLYLVCLTRLCRGRLWDNQRFDEVWCDSDVGRLLVHTDAVRWWWDVVYCVPMWGSCSCSRHGRCELISMETQWRCVCDEGWTGSTCQNSTETNCQDGVDNDAGCNTFMLCPFYLPCHLSVWGLFADYFRLYRALSSSTNYQVEPLLMFCSDIYSQRVRRTQQS